MSAAATFSKCPPLQAPPTIWRGLGNTITGQSSANEAEKTLSCSFHWTLPFDPSLPEMKADSYWSSKPVYVGQNKMALVFYPRGYADDYGRRVVFGVQNLGRQDLQVSFSVDTQTPANDSSLEHFSCDETKEKIVCSELGSVLVALGDVDDNALSAADDLLNIVQKVGLPVPPKVYHEIAFICKITVSSST